MNRKLTKNETEPANEFVMPLDSVQVQNPSSQQNSNVRQVKKIKNVQEARRNQVKQQTANAAEISPPRTSAANYSSQKTSPLRLADNQMQNNNTTIGSNGPQNTEDGSPGSPYQVILSHRRFNSALGQN